MTARDTSHRVFLFVCLSWLAGVEGNSWNRAEKTTSQSGWEKKAKKKQRERRLKLNWTCTLVENEDVSEVERRVGRLGWRRQHEDSGPQTPPGEPVHSLFSVLIVRLYWHGSCPPWLNAELLCSCLLHELREHSCLCCTVAQPVWVCHCMLCTQTDSQHHGQSLPEFKQQLSLCVSECVRV